VDQIKEMLNQLSELADDQVGELQSQIVGEFEAVEKEDPSPQTVDAMTSLADMLDSVRTEMKQREAAAQELAQRAAEAASRVYGEGDSAEEEMMADSETPMEEGTEEAGMDPEAEEMDKEWLWKRGIVDTEDGPMEVEIEPADSDDIAEAEGEMPDDEEEKP